MNGLNIIETFGDVAAEQDSVLDYFISTSAIDNVNSGKYILVLGRKGTGKTAIVRYFTEEVERPSSRAVSLRGYPWNVHAERIDHGASEIEAYVSSWRYLIAVELAILALSPQSAKDLQLAKPLIQFLNDNYGGIEPSLSDILRPAKLRLSSYSLKPQILGNSLGGIEMARKAGDLNFGTELNALSASIMKIVRDIIDNTNIDSLNLHFDELDQGISQLDDNRKNMLVGRILAVREITRENQQKKSNIKLIVYLRTDLWDELQFSDKNKITQSSTLHLAWNSSSLSSLIEARIKAKLGDNADWNTIAEQKLMRGSQSKWNHILSRTFLRPRDVIQFLNVALKESKKRDSSTKKFTNPDIVSAREEYSGYLKEELNDEINPHWAGWGDAIKAISGIATLTFERHEFEEKYNLMKRKGNDIDSDRALELMYRFSVIAYEKRSGYGGSSWSFQYINPEAGWDNSSQRFKVHLGLKEYAKLREARQ